MAARRGDAEAVTHNCWPGHGRTATEVYRGAPEHEGVLMTVWDGVQRGYIPGAALRIHESLRLRDVEIGAGHAYR
jgi:hypothetical protein